MPELIKLLHGELVISFVEAGLATLEAVALATECLFEIEDEVCLH